MGEPSKEGLFVMEYALPPSIFPSKISPCTEKSSFFPSGEITGFLNKGEEYVRVKGITKAKTSIIFFI